MNKLKTKLFKKKKEKENIQIQAFGQEDGSSQQTVGAGEDPQLLDVDELHLDDLGPMQSPSNIFSSPSALGYSDDNLDELTSTSRSTHDASALIGEPNAKGEDRYKSIYATAIAHGFVLKKYKYTTDDGYINTVFRLMKNRAATEAAERDELTDNDGVRYKIAGAFAFDRRTHQKDHVDVATRVRSSAGWMHGKAKPEKKDADFCAQEEEK